MQFYHPFRFHNPSHLTFFPLITNLRIQFVLIIHFSLMEATRSGKTIPSRIATHSSISFPSYQTIIITHSHFCQKLQLIIPQLHIYLDRQLTFTIINSFPACHVAFSKFISIRFSNSLISNISIYSYN